VSGGQANRSQNLRTEFLRSRSG